MTRFGMEGEGKERGIYLSSFPSNIFYRKEQ
jgi:hypothetical protein